MAIPRHYSGLDGHGELMPRRLRWNSEDPHFHVILTNASEQPIGLFDERCSWGYSALSFELTDEKGKKWIVKKAPRDWSFNMVSCYYMAPHEQVVVDVNFKEAGIWQGLPPVEGSSHFWMRAILEIVPSELSKTIPVWTGRIGSNPEECIFERH